ncbi:MAG: sulfurtransferase [Cyanophyceae cyanobacterium]
MSGWILSPEQAHQKLRMGAILWDARDPQEAALEPLPGSHRVNWQQFSVISRDPQRPDRGLLLEDGSLQQQLRDLGVCNQIPVVVVGSPPGDGRLVWMLRTLGHPQAALVNGGYQALVESQPLPILAARIPGDFQICRTSTWWIQQQELQACLGQKELTLVDARTLIEFGGEILYGEARAGHLANAINLPIQDLIDPAGQLLSPQRLDQRLAQAQLKPDQPLIVYCSGGIRAAWLACVLVERGFQVRNYAGSMWEWSAGSPQDCPLSWVGGREGEIGP